MNLAVTSTGVRYYMSYDNSRKTLYVSLPNEKRVVGLKLEEDGSVNRSTVAGSGKPCLGNGPCGDKGIATKAALAYPKVRPNGSML